jgi:hypothetical protein
VCIAQPVLGVLWKWLPRGRVADAVKLAVFAAVLAFIGSLARKGALPRTAPILPGEEIISD